MADSAVDLDKTPQSLWSILPPSYNVELSPPSSQTHVKTVSTSASNPTDVELFCVEECTKGRREEGRMIECSLCCRWYHYQCVNVKSHAKNAFWSCPLCRTMSSDIKLVHNQISQVLEMLARKDEVIYRLEQTVFELKEELSGLKESITRPTVQSSETPTPVKLEENLIIGDSILQSIDPKMLQETSVRTLRGATVEAVTTRVESIKPASSITLHVGTNDVSNGSSSEEFEGKFKGLLDVAKSKSRAVYVSSILPRSDGHDEAVMKANLVIAKLCCESGVTYQDNDLNFRHKDDSINNCLFRDGLHLNPEGTLKLTKNFVHVNNNIKLVKNVDSAKIKTKPAKNSDYRRSNGNADRYQRTYTTGCWHCGEEGHTKQQCRHDRPLLCYNCWGTGHKAKHCQ